MTKLKRIASHCNDDACKIAQRRDLTVILDDVVQAAIGENVDENVEYEVHRFKAVLKSKQQETETAMIL